ncbi:hypothetical protein IKS57_03690 [bacterium]|nr:hypothetical protein [bacterium]
MNDFNEATASLKNINAKNNTITTTVDSTQNFNISINCYNQIFDSLNASNLTNVSIT